MLSATIIPTIALLLVLNHVYKRAYHRLNKLPPGPLGLPLVGNILDMPTTEHWRVFSNWAKNFGDVVYLNILGKPFVILASGEAALDLFDKRSGIYSDRPHFVMAGELCGMERITPLARFGRPLREQRRVMQRVLSQTAVRRYEYIQVREIHGMIRRILAEPQAFASHIRRMAGSNILEIVYGYRVVADDDFLVKIAERAMLLSTRVGTSVWAVDFFPRLRNLPSWFPGAEFLRFAKECREIMEDSVEIPFNITKKEVNSKDSQPSLVSTLLRTEDDEPVDQAEEDRIKWTANSLYIAGADTTSAVVASFCLAMVMNPRAQSRAQEEIDFVIGIDRLPELCDRGSLPYVNCVVDECLRWNAPVPITPPRELMKCDEYRDWSIPKGTKCLANIWAMLRDESIYSNPEEFLPERFEENLDEELTKIRDPRTYVFGFGRRRCPGFYLAENSVWLSIANLLATVTVKNATDSDGCDVIPEVKFTSGGIRHPYPFRCAFEARENASHLQELLNLDHL